MDELHSFDSVVDERTRILILGTMPGAVSLLRGEYYAYRQNRFWRVMEEIAGVVHDAPYEKRLEGLLAAGVGLWDTLQVCVRKGSLDSTIRDAKPNDFDVLLSRHSSIAVIALNGKMAADVFRRQILPTLPKAVAERLTILELPSTSPANARGGLEAVVARWRVLDRWIDARGS